MGRHLSTIIAGSCRFADRLKAAKLVTDDTCSHPECGGARCDAEHWNYHCHHNSAARKETGQAIDDYIELIKQKGRR